MKKIEAKELARDIIQDAIGVAYYRLWEGDGYSEYTENEKELIEFYLHKEAERMLNLVGRRYISY